MKILVIRLSSIGDIVLTTPVIRCLKQQIPSAIIHFLTKEQYLPILAHNPYIDKQIAYNNQQPTQTFNYLKQEQYDVIIDLHHNLRTAAIKSHLRKVKSYSFPKLNIEKWIYTNFKINLLPKKHIVDRYFKTVEHLGVKNDEKGLDFFINPNEKLASNDIPISHIHGYIAIVIGAALSTKQLPKNKLIDLCKEIEYPIILIGGDTDKLLGEQIAKEFPVKVYNAAGKFSIHESAQLIQQSKLVITPDTGMMHIAAALQKPIISIWGNTTAQFGMYPYYGQQLRTNFSIEEVKQLSCRPCSKIGYQQCPKKHFKCMNLISTTSIAQKALQQVK